jgi:hypothetical protein
VRILDTKASADRIDFELAGPAGSSAQLRVWRGEAVTVHFPAGAVEFTRANVTFQRLH